LIEYYTEDGYTELFDLQSDPNELSNRSNDGGYKEIRKDLTAQLRGLQKDYGDLEG
jgi:hypothetical protein